VGVTDSDYYFYLYYTTDFINAVKNMEQTARGLVVNKNLAGSEGSFVPRSEVSSDKI
jgi:hypothetical protein